jgi:hypothetical protein
MSIKGIFIVILLLLLIIFVISGIFYFFGAEPGQPIGNNHLPSGNGTTPPPPPPSSQDLIPVKTRTGGTMSVKNFYKNAKEITAERDVIIADGADYILMYFPKDQSFIIRLNNPDVRNARAIAENALLAFLNITKEQACNIHVSVTIPLAVSSTYGGKDYGLSFCSWGIPF